MRGEAQVLYLSLPHIARILKCQIWKILAVSLASGLITGLWSYALSPIYESRATILPRSGGSPNPLSFKNGKLLNDPKFDQLLSSDDSYEELDRLRKFLKSDFLVMQVLEANSFFLEPQSVSHLSVEKKMQLRDELSKNLVIRIDGPALFLRFRDSDVRKPQRVITAFLENLQRDLNLMIQGEGKKVEVFSEARLRELQSDLQEAEEKREHLAHGDDREHTLGSLEFKMARANRDYHRLLKLIDWLHQRYHLGKMEAKREDPAFIVLDSPSASFLAVGPFHSLNIFAGFLCGLVGAIGFFLWRAIFQLEPRTDLV